MRFGVCIPSAAKLLLTVNELTMAEVLEADGKDVGSFWLDFAGVELTSSLEDVASNVLSRFLLLQIHNVNLGE